MLFRDLLNVDLYKLCLVADNPRSPSNPVSFRNSRSQTLSERSGPSGDSSSSIKSRWSSIPPPYLVRSMDCHQELHSFSSSMSTENRKSDKIGGEISSSYPLRKPVRPTSPVVNNRKQIEAATSKIRSTLRIPVRQASPVLPRIRSTLRIPVRQASLIVNNRKGLPPMKTGAGAATSKTRTTLQIPDRRASPVVNTRKGLPPSKKGAGATASKTNMLKSTTGIPPRPTLIRQLGQKSFRLGNLIRQLSQESFRSRNLEKSCDLQNLITSELMDKSLEDIGSDDIMSINPVTTPVVEISPGVFRPLRGSKETWDAIERGFCANVDCFSCSTTLLCIYDAEFVICPVCKVISPAVTYDDSLPKSGVGLGLRSEELLQQWG
jgi:hypothetical protein